MQALKDIAGLASALGASPISKSPIWGQPIDKILPAQLISFRERMKSAGKRDQADAAIDYIVNQVSHMVDKGLLPVVPLLDYTEPRVNIMTGGEFLVGLSRMGRPLAALALFALETGMTPEQVITLTRHQARKLDLSARAREIIAAQPISITTRFIFWRDYNNRHMPIFGFDKELFDAFGETWGEFSLNAKNVVWLS